MDEETTIIFEAALDTDLDFIEKLPYDIIKIKQYKTNMHVFVKRRKQDEISNLPR